MAALALTSANVKPSSAAARSRFPAGVAINAGQAVYVDGSGLVQLGGIATLAFIPSVLSFTMIVALTGLELVVAILQAFVFAALATVYLNEVVNFGHGH